MKVHLAFDHRGINHYTHLPYWDEAVKSLGWERAELEKADFTVMWGINQEFERTRDMGKPVLMIDFPYWNRGEKERTGKEYYKVSLNGQHPTKYIFTEKFGPKRYKETGGPEIKEWREYGNHIVVAGMGIKASAQNGYSSGQWEKSVIEKIQKQTQRPIYYRPKPRQAPVPLIPGVILDKGLIPIQDLIRGAHCVVCHHGNPTIDALAQGIPIFMNGPIGVASHLASFDFNNIMNPVFPENRQQFFNNIAYWQWSVDEIKTGAVLRSYHQRGLI